LEKIGGSVIWIVEVKNLYPLMAQDLRESLGITAIPLGDSNNRSDFRPIMKGGINPFDPTAKGPGKAFFFGLIYPGKGLRRGDKDII
jgi:hypothetical protein